MYRLVLVLPLLFTGCGDARKLTKEQVETSVREKCLFSDISLHPTGEHKYSGTAKDPAGEYDLTVEVSRTRISFKAEGRPRKLTRERVELALAKQLALAKIELEQKAPDRFEGPGVTRDGEKLDFEVAVNGIAYAVKWKDNEGKPRNIQMTITDGNMTSRAMSYSP